MKHVYDLVIQQTIPHYFTSSEKDGYLTFNFNGKSQPIKLSNRLEKIEYRCSKNNNFNELSESFRQLDKKLEAKIIFLKNDKLSVALIKWRKGRLEQITQPKVNEMIVSFDEAIKLAKEIL